MNTPTLRHLLTPLLEHPAVALLRLATFHDEHCGEPDAQTRIAMRSLVRGGSLAALPAPLAWRELQAGLMGPHPARMLRTLRGCGALEVLLPEVDALFGVPLSADDPPTVDLGGHVLASLEQAARQRAPREVRVALLLMHTGKSDSPREHLPSHYRHLERAAPRIDAVCARFGLEAAVRDFSLLALAECERMHRAAASRAGSVAALLARIGAFDDPQRFEGLLAVCRCDFHAYPGREALPYPKEALLRTALGACLAVDAVPQALQERDADAATALLLARTSAVARALRSQRWAASHDGAG